MQGTVDGAGGGAWGSITGTLEDQTDLNSVLDAFGKPMLWSSTYSYSKGMPCLYQGFAFYSLVDNNVGNDPVRTMGYWSPLTVMNYPDGYNGALAVGAAVKVRADLATALGESTQALTSTAHAEGYYTQAWGKADVAITVIDEANSTVTVANTTGLAVGQPVLLYMGMETPTEFMYSTITAINGNVVTLADPPWEGVNTLAYPSAGIGNVGARGQHAEGNNTRAHGSASHAEGLSTLSLGANAHTEGKYTQAFGESSHAEGLGCRALGDATHAEGYGTFAMKSASHAEGLMCRSTGGGSHAEGSFTLALTSNTHTEGDGSEAWGMGQCLITAYDNAAKTLTVDNATGLEQGQRILIFKGLDATGDIFYAFVNNINGLVVTVNITLSLSGTGWVLAYPTGLGGATGMHAEGQDTAAHGSASHAEGFETRTFGDYSHAEGQGSLAYGNAAHAEGSGTLALGSNSHAEGTENAASGDHSHAEGRYSTASGRTAHAEGEATMASGTETHSEGYSTMASGDRGAHAEGNSTIASGDASHAEGYTAVASGKYSHAGGDNTIAQGYAQTVIGQWNIAQGDGTTPVATDDIFIVGNGTGIANNRANALALKRNGDMTVAGRLRQASPATATLTTAGWSGTSAPFTQSVNVTGITASDSPIISPVYSTNNATAILERAAWNLIGKAVTGAGTITFTCFETKPTQQLSIQIKGA